MRRSPAVAGQFYPAKSSELRALVEEYVTTAVAPRPAIGLMVPHAGYLYSGAIAGATFAAAVLPPRIILLGPNHTGHGKPMAVAAAGEWVTPLGETSIDADLAGEILAADSGLADDALAHRFEHSLEVQLPFIQVLAAAARIVPICLAPVPLERLLDLGRILARVIRAHTEPILLVASSDMTHYEPGTTARRKDQLALDHICAVDAEGLFSTVVKHNISMCGVVPAVVMLAAARELGGRQGTVIRYGNSGDVTGDQAEVVGYSGVLID